jgi:hypothetical protein
MLNYTPSIPKQLSLLTVNIYFDSIFLLMYKDYCPEFLVQPAENAEIVRPEIHDRGSISIHSTLCM